MNIGELTATIGCDSSSLKRAEGDLRAFGSTADNQFSSVIGKAAALAASLLTVSVAIKAISDAATTGMKVETMGVVMNQIGKNVQISTQALQYFKKEVESAGVTGMEAMSALSKAMTLGLNLNQMKEFTTRVRDVAVGARDAAGNLMNTSQTVNAVMHGIQSGQVEVLRNLGVTVRGTEEVYKSYAATIGKTKEQLNDAQKAQAMMNEFMRASALMAGAAAAADETVGKQLASMARYSEEAKVALWSIFQPGMMAAVQGMTQGFKDLKKWAEENSASLTALGVRIGEFVTSAISAAGSVVKWVAANLDLMKSLAEFYILVKITEWALALKNGIVALYGVMIAGEVVTATAQVIKYGSALDAVAGFASVAKVEVAAAGAAAQTSGAAAMAGVAGWIALGKVIVIAAAAWTSWKDAQREHPIAGVMFGGDADAYNEARNAPPPEDFSGYETPLPGGAWNYRTKESSEEQARLAHQKKLAEPGGAGRAGKGGGGDGGAFAEAGRLASLFDSLTKDISRLSEGKLSEIEANYIKTVDQIYKKSEVRATSEAELEVLAKTRSTLQKAKLQDDFDLKMAKDSGDVFLSIQKDYEKDLSDFNGLAGAKEKTEANRAKKELDARQKFQEQIMEMQSASWSAMASTVPLLSQQLPIEKDLLDIELKRGDLKMEEELRVLKTNHMISAGQEDEMRHLKALENQYKKYEQERKGWMLEGIGGGLKAGSLDRDKESATRTAQWTIDAMKGVETWLGETGGQAFVDYLHGKKMDLTKMFQDMGDSLIKQLFKMGTTKLFDTIWSGVGKALGLEGKGKPDGSAGNPFHVTFKGMGIPGIGKATGAGAAFERTAQKAGKVGMTVPGGGALGDWSDDIKGLKTYDKLYDQMIKGQTKDWKMTDKLSDKFWKESKKDATTYSKMQDEMIDQNQELFKADYLTTYQDSFTGMATGITGVWGTAQGLMTAAGVSGETQRYGTMVAYGMQGLSFIMQLAKAKILVDAYQGAASAFKWVMATVPAPANFPLAAAAAAVTFAAIAAYGAFGGSTGSFSGGGTMNSGNYTANPNVAGSGLSSAGGDYQVGNTGPRYVHQDETILPVWAANSWRDIVSREASGSGSGRPGENGGAASLHLGGVSVTINNPPENFNASKLAHDLAPELQKLIDLKRIRVDKILNRELGRRGRRL